MSEHLTAKPTAAGDRYGVMDVLRGFALFGVLLVNLYEYGGEDILATGKQLSTLSTAGLDANLEFGLKLFAYGKANTLFAFLFGLGFWVQMQRLEARGAPFKAIYLKRTLILLAIGWIHLLGLFAWEILHVYGIAALILFCCRGLADRALFWLGLLLLLFAQPALNWIAEFIGLSGSEASRLYTDSAVLERQAAALSGDFPAFISSMNQLLYFDWFFNGALVAWIFYALGRFFMGAWVARQGWIQNSQDHLSLFRRWLAPMLFGGLLFEAVHLLNQDVSPDALGGALPYLIELLHLLATPMIAAGYVCLIVLLFQARAWRWLVKPFAPVGQMALTNYLTQSVVIVLILTSIGPGLGLAGKAALTTFLPLVVLVFAAQAVFSFVWLKWFYFGPAEWLWRALTYGTIPPMRRGAKASG